MKKKSTKRFEINKKEIRVNLETLQKDVERAYDSMKKIIPDKILKNQEVKKFGNAGHIILPKDYVGKKVTVMIKKE